MTEQMAGGSMQSGGLDFLNPWLAPFPLMVGLLVLALLAFLAAAYCARGSSRAKGYILRAIERRGDSRRNASAAKRPPR